MIISYLELKEAVQDSYDDLHVYAGYSAKDTFYATLADYESHCSVTETLICCIYVNLSLLFIENEKNINFMMDELAEQIDDSKIEIYKKELKNEFDDFCKDLLRLRTLLYGGAL